MVGHHIASARAKDSRQLHHVFVVPLGPATLGREELGHFGYVHGSFP